MTAAIWLNLHQAAQYSGFSEDHLRKQMQTGDLQAVQRKWNAPWRTRPEWLDRWMAGEKPPRKSLRQTA